MHWKHRVGLIGPIGRCAWSQLSRHSGMPRPALKLQLGLENAMHLGVKNGSKTTDETFEFTVLNDVDILIEKICHAKGRGRGLIHRHFKGTFSAPASKRVQKARATHGIRRRSHHQCHGHLVSLLHCFLLVKERVVASIARVRQRLQGITPILFKLSRSASQRCDGTARANHGGITGLCPGPPAWSQE